MQLRWWVVAGVVTVVVAGGAAVYLWRAQAPAHVRPGNTVSLRDGQVTFRAPHGWRRQACPANSSGCVLFRPPGGAPSSATAGDLGDAVTVTVMTPDPEGDVSRLLLDPAVNPVGGVSHFTVDGVRFVRVPWDAITLAGRVPAGTLVLGVLPNNDQVRVLCQEQTEPDLVRAGCQVVIGSLHVRT